MTKLQHPVPKDVLTAIGDMTVSFALLEMTIQTLAESLISNRQRIGQIVTSELPFPRLVTLTRALYLEGHSQDADYPTLDRLLREADKVYSERNLVIHSLWATGSSPDSATRVKFTARDRGGFTAKFREVDARAVQEQVEGIKSLARQFQAFWVHLVETGKESSGAGAPR